MKFGPFIFLFLPYTLGQVHYDQANRKWISQIYAETQASFNVAPEATKMCKLDMQIYQRHLQNQTVWAVRMFESSGWPTSSLLGGITYHMGNWDECLISRGPNNIKGQYCLVQTKLHLKLNLTDKPLESAWVEWPREDDSAWDVINKFEKDPIRISRLEYTWALCAPSSCTINDLKKSLNHTLYPIFQSSGIEISVNIHPAVCKVQEDKPFSRGFYYAAATFATIILLVILSSLYDFTRRKKIKADEDSFLVLLFLCFSAVQSYNRLTYYSPNSTYIPINFAKVICMIMIIYGHRLFLMYGYPSFHAEQIEMTYTASNIQLVQTDIVDVFFALTGFLTFFLGFKPMKQGGLIYLVFSLIFRWLRLIPTFGLVMLYFMFIMPYTSDGPFWKSYETRRIGDCYQNWWTTLFAVNNVVNPNKPCIPVNWYIAVDMQLTLLGTALLFVIIRKRKIGYFLTFIIFTCSSFLIYSVVYFNGYYGIPRWFMKSLEDPIPLEEYWGFYVKSYTRVGPYLMGFISGAITKKLNKRKFKFSAFQMTCLILTGTIIGLGFQMYGMLFFKTGRPYNPLENGLYAAIHRTLFVLPVACLICVYFTSGLGILNFIIHCKVYLPFGRLTYCTLLTSYILQIYHILSQKTFLSLNNGQNTIMWAGSDILYSFILAFFLYLISEGPLNNFSKLLQSILIKKFMRPNSTMRPSKDSDSSLNTTSTELKSG